MSRPFLQVLTLVGAMASLGAQADRPQDQEKASVEQARLGLKSPGEQQQLAALRLLGGAPEDRVVELRVAEVLRIGLASKHVEVVKAAIEALVVCADRKGSAVVLAEHVAGLRARLEQAKAPNWPVLPKFEVPELPRLPPKPPATATSKERKEYEAVLKLALKRIADQKQARVSAQELREKNLASAQQQDEAMRLAARDLGACALRLQSCREDPILDEVLGSLDTCLKRCASESGPLLAALASCGRRDAVRACATIMIEANTGGGAVSLCLAQTIARETANVKFVNSLPSVFVPNINPDLCAFLRSVRAPLEAVGDRHGVPIPEREVPSDPTDEAMKEYTASLDEQARQWRQWLAHISPLLPERLATGGK